MADPTQLAVAVWLGVLFGVFVRTIIPYVNKHAADGTLTWDWKYAATAAVVFLGSIATAQTVIQTYIPPAADSLALSFIAAFIYALTLNHIANEAIDKGK